MVYKINGDRYKKTGDWYYNKDTGEPYDTTYYTTIYSIEPYRLDVGTLFLEASNLTFSNVDIEIGDNVTISIGKENQSTYITFLGTTYYICAAYFNFVGNVGIYVDSQINSKYIFSTESSITGNVNLIVKNGSIASGSNITVLFKNQIDESYINSNPLYNISYSSYYDSHGYYVITNTITPKTSAEIQTAGFTASQANRLVEIMQTTYGADPTNDEIVKLAQMGDIAGAKELLGGDAPVIKQRQAYLNGKMRQTFVNGKQRNIYIGASNE